MKLRGRRGGIHISFENNESVEDVKRQLEAQSTAIVGECYFEVAGKLNWDVVSAATQVIEAAGGTIGGFQSVEQLPTVTAAAPPVKKASGETKIIARTVRSGGRVESTGSAIILGDVNAGAEIVAEGDVVVVGTLRGLVHAGASGNESAIIWAQEFKSPNLRIAGYFSDDAALIEGVERSAVVFVHENSIKLKDWS